MASKLWFMKLYFAIGVTMLIIGLSLFSATLYMRRRAKSTAKLMSLKGSNTAYSHIDLNDNIFIKPRSLNDNIGDNDRTRKVKIRIIEGKRELRDMENDQIKFSKLIVEEKITTHRIVDNEIIYSDRVINDFPDLHKHLIKLHGINNKIQYYWDELDSTYNHDVLLPNRATYIENRKLIYNDINQLISNDLDLNSFLKSKIKLSNQNSIIDENVLNYRGKVDKSTGEKITPTITDYHAYLDEHILRLRKNKFKLEKDLKKRKSIKEFYEAIRLTYK